MDKALGLLTTGSGVRAPPLQPYKTLKNTRNSLNFTVFEGFFFGSYLFLKIEKNLHSALFYYQFLPQCEASVKPSVKPFVKLFPSIATANSGAVPFGGNSSGGAALFIFPEPPVLRRPLCADACSSPALKAGFRDFYFFYFFPCNSVLIDGIICVIVSPAHQTARFLWLHPWLIFRACTAASSIMSAGKKPQLKSVKTARSKLIEK